MSRELLNVGSNVVRVGVRAVWGIVLPGLLSVHEFGRYTLILGGAQIVSTIALLGAPNAALSGGVDVRLLLTHAIVLGAVLSGALVVFASLGGAAAYLLVAVQILSLHVLLSAWARGQGRFRELLVAYVGGYALFALAAIATLAAVDGFGAMLPLWLELIGPAASLILLLWLVARPRSPESPAPPRVAHSWRAALRPVYAIGGLVVIDVIIWRRVEIFFLQGSPSGSTGVAVFGLAIQLAATAMLLPAAVLESWYPEFAARWGSGTADFQAHVRARLRTYRLLHGAVAGGALAAFAIAIPFVYPDYRPWLGLVLGLIGMRLAAGYVGFHATVLYATGRELALYGPVLAGAVVALAAHGLLTLPYGLSALPAAYAATHGVIAAGTWWAYRRRAADTPPARVAADMHGGPLSPLDP